METHEQIMTFRPNSPIVIATPVGLIKLDRIKDEGTRKVKITLPRGLRASIGEKEALNRSDFLEKKNGEIVPNFSMLLPAFTPDGKFAGVASPAVIPLGDVPTEETNEQK
jgi:hypothetical protein